MILLDKIKKGLIGGFHAASDITSEYTKMGRLKIDVIGVKKVIEEKMLELGGRVYDKVNNEHKLNFKNEETINKIIIEINHLEKELKKYELKLEEIKTMDETSILNINK